MREYKIIVDYTEKEPFIIQARDGFLGKFKMIESTPTHEEAIIYCNGKNGRFLGTYLSDGVPVAKGQILNGERYVEQEYERLYPNLGNPGNVLDENENVLFGRTIKGKKCF